MLVYLHMCNLVLLPVKALHLVLLQFFSGFHILIIITLHIANDTSPSLFTGSETIHQNKSRKGARTWKGMFCTV